MPAFRNQNWGRTPLQESSLTEGGFWLCFEWAFEHIRWRCCNADRESPCGIGDWIDDQGGVAGVMGKSLIYTTAHRRAILAALMFCAACPRPATANEQLAKLAKTVGVRILADGTSEKDVQSYAASRLPYNRMSASARQRAAQITSNTSQFRRMPSLQYTVDPNIYQYLINNPDVAVSTWRVMGISKLQMFQTGQFEYEASAADGSEGIADILWRDGRQCVFVVQGKYSSPLIPAAIHASALVWLQYRFVRQSDGGYVVNQQVETFIHFPSHTVDVIARLASRVTNTILDRNVFEVSLYARMMSQAAEKEPEWVEQLAQRMDGVLPQRKVELVQVSRGQSPGGTQLMASSSGRKNSNTGLTNSGGFRDFEHSLHKLNQHIPIVPRPASQLRGDTGQSRPGLAAGSATTQRPKAASVMPTARNDSTGRTQGSGRNKRRAEHSRMAARSSFPTSPAIENTPSISIAPTLVTFPVDSEAPSPALGHAKAASSAKGPAANAAEQRVAMEGTRVIAISQAEQLDPLGGRKPHNVTEPFRTRNASPQHAKQYEPVPVPPVRSE